MPDNNDNLINNNTSNSQYSMDEITTLKSLCHLYADRLDQIQSGGGNASIKSAEVDRLYIKASGYLMSDVSLESGFSVLKLSEINALLMDVKNGVIDLNDEPLQNSRLSLANQSTLRPSIETYLHAMLSSRLVLHVHSFAAMFYASTKDFKKRLAIGELTASFSEGVLLVPYRKPGISLALAMLEQLESYRIKFSCEPKWIVLQNHGLIIMGNSVEMIDQRNIEFESLLLKDQPKLENIITPYQRVTDIKNTLHQIDASKAYFVRYSGIRLPESMKRIVFSFPDAVVFCGPEILYVDDSAQMNEMLSAFYRENTEAPKVLILLDEIYVIGTDLRKLYELEDVLKIQMKLNEALGEAIQGLNDSEIEILTHWEAEKYRKKLKV